jgi:photosystem II stability/assembly factor-like uncharacterized protein
MATKKPFTLKELETLTANDPEPKPQTKSVSKIQPEKLPLPEIKYPWNRTRQDSWLGPNLHWQIKNGCLIRNIYGPQNYHEIILRSSDYNGGRIKTIFFLNQLFGWVAGSGGSVLKTYNGGNTWRKLHGPSLDTFDINALFFINETIGWLITTRGTILKTLNGGIDWHRQRPSGKKINETPFIFFFDEKSGTVVNRYGRFLITTDGGQNWEEWQDSPSAESAMTFTALLTESTGK